MLRIGSAVQNPIIHCSYIRQLLWYTPPWQQSYAIRYLCYRWVTRQREETAYPVPHTDQIPLVTEQVFFDDRMHERIRCGQTQFST